MTTSPRLLIVDDEPVVRESLGNWFREEGYEVETACSGKETLEKIARSSWDLFLIDVRMPGMDGLELQRRILEIQPGSAIIIMTAYASVETAVKALKQGAYDYIIKPFEPEALETMARKALEQGKAKSLRAAPEAGAAPREEPPCLIGKSPGMDLARREIERLAGSDVPVLFLGERGTGKELSARTIHALSPRRHLTFAAVNCTGVNGETIRQELFGHEAGAFPGALSRRKGRMELADGGSLFFDEIGALEPGIQVDLLRALEDGEFLPLGGEKPISSDFRLLAATSRDLAAEVRSGRFQEDLFRKLEAFQIRLPPLRERREDIPLLAERFLDESVRVLGRPRPRISREAMEDLLRRDWPRNVEELRTAIERAAVAASGEEILPENLRERPEPTGSAPGGDPERERLARTLEESGWNLTRAAGILGIDRAALFEKMKALGLRRPGS